ncbi:hypothetical protein LCGC14_1386000 [marine sediment metagenome]|uniref:Uncharacterized protein n=1 Tax=marine sediment metagenome TaxID=412755 RepID=A0A0F9N2W5_9ZZZZ
MKLCEGINKYSDTDQVQCRHAARRVSEGRHYCHEHFDIVIDAAKSKVVEEVVTFLDGCKKAHHVISEAHNLTKTVNRLKELGWEPGD